MTRKAIDKSMELTDIHLVEKAEEKAGYIETRKNSMKDRFGREIDYLRISITDRCNLRCVYCMPENGVVQIPHEEILTYDEITRISRCMTGLGIRKIKLTGGEPLIRKNCATLVRMLKELPGIEKVTLTTNGVLLEEQIADLAEAGLDDINISLDTLNAAEFAKVTRRKSGSGAGGNPGGITVSADWIED